ncbi:MAG: zf-TFIIB domain-containing protein [Bdellovibrionaceae bacterium]|nr:zf-TFIIB domain-containing protein [Pseudobdellovibrionaceae bacterium]
MICPACDSKLSEKTFDGIDIDVCDKGCGGLWFDWMELKKFDEPHEATGSEILDIIAQANASPDMDKRHKCPKCEDIVLYRHFFSVKKHVEIDECPTCGGFWLDAGELSALRSLFKNEEDRIKAAEDVFEDLFSGDLKKLKEKSKEEYQKARTIAKLFKFICPSNYISGKQDWGAW